MIENLAATPTWWSSHVSPSDMTALRRRWPRAVLRTMNCHGLDMERLRRGARHRPNRAFRHNAPGFCPVCEDWIESALDMHMTNEHLEMAQLWRCPVEWCAVWKGSVRACQEHLSEKHGGSSLFDLKNVAKFFPPPPSWTVSCHVWQTALQPDVSGVSVDARFFYEAGCRLVHRYRVYKDPFPHPALRDGVIPRLLSCVGRAMAITRLTHLRISIPASGASSGQVPTDCFLGGAPRRSRPGSLRVTFADDVSMPAVGSPTVCSPVLDEPAPLVFPIVVKDVVIPEGETYGPADVVLDAIPPPAGFPPFSWPIASECVAVERFGSSLSDGALPDGLVSNPDVEPPFSLIAQDQVSASADSPDDVLLISPLVDVATDSVPDVTRPVAPSPPVEQLFAQDRLWAPVAVPVSAIDNRRETPVPRWRLAWEGPFMAERSPELIRSLVAGCAFRNTTYRCSDYDTPSGEFGLPVHHPRFLEWIGVAQSACLLEMGAGRWVDVLSRDGAVAAAVQLQRDVGLMQTNLDVLDQYSLALQRTASKLIEVCLGARPFPTEEVAAGALGPRVRRASIQMEVMGLWQPSMDPLRRH